MPRWLVAASVALIMAFPILIVSPSAASNVPLQFGSGTPPATLTLGGVTGPLTWSGNGWTMTVAGQTFATGTLNTITGQATITSMPGFASCRAGCTTTLSTTLSGQVAVVNHGAFVSAVARWAAANRAALASAGLNPGAVVSAAARGTTLKAAGATVAPAGTSTTTTTTSTTTTGGTFGRRGTSGHSSVSGHARGGGGASGAGLSSGHASPDDLLSAGPNTGGQNGGGHGGGGHGGGHGR